MNTNTSNNANSINNIATTTSSSNNSCHNSSEKLNSEQEPTVNQNQQHNLQAPPQRSTSSCETLAASDGITLCNGLDPNSPLSKPLPPLPSKNANKLANHTTSGKLQHQTNIAACSGSSSSTNPKLNSTNNLNNSQAHLASQGIHHAQPYYQTPPTPTLMAKRDYQQPPPVPPHQNNNHTTMAALNHHHHHLPPSGHQAPLTPCLDQQRRTLDRSMRNLPYSQNSGNISNNHEANMNLEGLTTRIPSLRRTRRTSGGSNNGVNSMSSNPNGGLGIPIAVAAGSPRVQRSPMPARATMMKQRSRLGSHNDNISSGSLNSIEV